MGPLQPNWEPREHAWCWRKGEEVSVAAAERGEGVAGEMRVDQGGPESSEGLWLRPEGGGGSERSRGGASVLPDTGSASKSKH